MRSHITTILALSILLNSCSSPQSQRTITIEKEIASAKIEIESGNLKEAEQRLSACVANIGPEENLLLLKLKALNTLYNLELTLKNHAKSAKILKETSSYGEVLAETARPGEGLERQRLYEEAKISVINLGDQLAGEGYYQSARRLYKRAIQLEIASGNESKSENSITRKLDLLNSHEDSEENALGQGERNPAFDNKDVQIRRAAKRKLMDEIKVHYINCAKRPDKKIVEKMLALLSQIETAYGRKEPEFRGALFSTANCLSLTNQHEAAIALLESDAKHFSNVTDEGFKKTDPTTIENAKYLFTDSFLIASNQNALRRNDKTLEAGKRALLLAEQLKDDRSSELVQVLNFCSLAHENQGLRNEALPYRERQEKILTILNHENKAEFFHLQSDLASDLASIGKFKEAQSKFIRSIDYFRKNTKSPMLLVAALNGYAESMLKQGRNDEALELAKESATVSAKDGNLSQKSFAYHLASEASFAAGNLSLSEKFRIAQIQILETSQLDQFKTHYIAALSRLGDTQYLQKQWKQSAITLRKALAAMTTKGVNDACLESTILNVLAGCENKFGNLKEEEKLRLKAYSRLQKVQPNFFLPWLSTINQLGTFYKKQHRYKDAERFLKESINLTEMGNSTEMLHQNCYAKAILGQTLIDDNRTKEACAIKDDLIKIYPNSFGIEPERQISLLIDISDLCANLKDYPEALRALKFAEELTEKHPVQKKAFQNVLTERKTNLSKVIKRHN